MATEWRVKGTELANCNCAYGCPCQFNALPTHGHCRAAAAWEIEEGHFGEVHLDGLRSAFLISFPGAAHQGNGGVVRSHREFDDVRHGKFSTRFITTRTWDR